MRGAPNVSDQRRRRVLRAAEELGYRPNAFARSLASKRLDTIGVLINDVTNPYFGGVYSSLASAAERAGLDLLVAPGTRSAAKESDLVHTLLEHRVAGLVLLSPLMSSKDMRRLTLDVPTVVIGRGASLATIDVVTTDERQAALSVVGHLAGLGHRDIVHINGGSRRAAHDRSRAYREAMVEVGLQPREVRGAFTDEGGRRGGQAVLELRPVPTAVIGANDLIAVGAMGVFRSHGLRVPEDISVVGYDDSQIARLELVNLTSVRQPVDQFGEVAVSLLTERIAETRTDRVVERLATTLVHRCTTAPPPTGRRHL
jgi:DNA-binding LacI/PurR family transcriptional regulator